MKAMALSTLLDWPVRITNAVEGGAHARCGTCGDWIMDFKGAGPLRELVDAVEGHARERHPETIG